MKKIFVIITLIALSPLSYPAEWIGGADGMPIGYLHVTTAGDVRVYSATGSWGGSDCSEQSNILLRGTSSGFDPQYAAILAAYIGKKTIRIYTTACVASVSDISVVQILD